MIGLGSNKKYWWCHFICICICGLLRCNHWWKKQVIPEETAMLSALFLNLYIVVVTNRNNNDVILFVFIFVFVGCWSAIHGGKQVIAEETAMRHSTSGHQSCTTSYLWALVTDSSSKSLIQIRNTELKKKTQLQSCRPTRVLQHKQLDAECGQQLPIKVSQKEKKVREAQQKSKAPDVSNS